MVIRVLDEVYRGRGKEKNVSWMKPVKSEARRKRSEESSEEVESV